tara:strand:- start:319 stop:3459 length:3141 start_codon:yes stop_codon:yes gene_type:complete
MNNFKLLSVVIVLSQFYISNAQDDYYGDNLNSNIYKASQMMGSPTVQPPDVAAFQKSTFVPVSNYTGRANINIPIYQVVAGSMSVPISLSYNSSGVKVNDMASNVGLNWSLSAGGVVSKIVKGMDDFYSPGPISNSSTGTYITPSGWLGCLAPFVSSTPELNRYNDAQPDVFSVSAPGLSTNYIHKRHYSVLDENGFIFLNGSPSPIELEHQGNLINETLGMVSLNYLSDSTGSIITTSRFGITNLEITSLNGIKYSFGTPDLSRFQSAFDTFLSYKFESFRLDHMFDPASGQAISFEYEQYSNYFYDDIDSKVNSYGGGTDLSNLTSRDKSHSVYPVTQRLKKIIYHGGEVEFIYGLDRLDNTGDKALTEVIVRDVNDVVVKHVKLDYDYFQSSIENNTPQSKRLRLDRVYDVNPLNSLEELPGHVFTYDTNLVMPPRESYAHDFLGYSNGTYNSLITNPIPKYYFEDNKITPFYSNTAIELPGNFSLEANENYAKTYSLTSIQFPTGGTNSYEYELNRFNYFGEKEGGGLRIKSQSISDGNGNVQILDYEYSSGTIGRMPDYAAFRLKNQNWNPYVSPSSFSELTSYFGIDTFMSPQSQVEFTNGSFVGYGIVKVRDRIANGYTYYRYSTDSDSNSTKTFTNSNAYSNAWSIISSPSLYVDRDYKRGKIKEVVIYDQSGNPRHSKAYSYIHKEFSTIPLDYLNKASTYNTWGCYNSDGSIFRPDYQEGCGAYKEVINLPIARYLLKSVVTKDYTNGSNNQPIVTMQKYLYDNQYPLVIQESQSTCDDTTQDGDQPCQELNYEGYDYQMVKQIAYVNTTTSDQSLNIPSIIHLPNVNELIAQNRLATPLKVVFKNRDYTVIGEEEHHYKDFGNNILALEKIETFSKTGAVTPSAVITRRDANGNIIEYQDKSGLYKTIIYGYNNMYPIAIVDGATYDQVNTMLQSEFGQGLSYVIGLSDSETTDSTEDTLRLWLSKIRIAVLNQSQEISNVVSYTYDHLTGVTSITDARGETAFFEYDDFHRLKFVRDKDLNLLSKNEYNYKLQN